MGSVRRFDTKLLVAVDVSGSISDKTLSHFYSVINKFFKYGINEIDCVQFDYDLGEVKPIRKASRTVQIFGRGGTSREGVDYQGAVADALRGGQVDECVYFVWGCYAVCHVACNKYMC